MPAPARKAIEESCRKHILPGLRLMDLQPQERLRDFLAAADIHCIPQKKAVADLVMPSKLLNIMAVGRPVVVAAEPHTELAQTIRRADCGLLVPPEDPLAFSRALRRLIDHPELRERLGANGRRFVERELSTRAVLGTVARDVQCLAAAWRCGDRGVPVRFCGLVRQG